MKTKFIAILVTIITFLALPTLAGAETQKARVYCYVTEMYIMPIGFVKAPAYVISERRGLAEFENGKVAAFLMRGAGKATPKGGPMEGFTQYTFNDKSTFVVKWQGMHSKGEGQQLPQISGEGTYVNGTGRFEGIQGDVTFTGKNVTPYDKEKGLLGDLIVDVVFNYTLPSK